MSANGAHVTGQSGDIFYVPGKVSANDRRCYKTYVTPFLGSTNCLNMK